MPGALGFMCRTMRGKERGNGERGAEIKNPQKGKKPKQAAKRRAADALRSAGMGRGIVFAAKRRREKETGALVQFFHKYILIFCARRIQWLMGKIAFFLPVFIIWQSFKGVCIHE